MILREVEVGDYRVTIDDARLWWGQELPTETTEDGLELITEYSVLEAFMLKMGLLEMMLDRSPFEIFHDMAFMIDTMLNEDNRGQLEFVETRAGESGELLPGYRLVPIIDPDDPFNF